MNTNYLPILVAAGVFSATAVTLFSRYRKGNQRKELQNEQRQIKVYAKAG